MDAAASIGIPIPSLCYLKEINEIAACRICVVEAAEMRGATLGPARRARLTKWGFLPDRRAHDRKAPNHSRSRHIR